MIGKALPVANRDPDGPPAMYFHDIGSKLRKHIHLCGGCRKWKPGSDELNCPIAQAVYELFKSHGVGGPITQCPHMDPK